MGSAQGATVIRAIKRDKNQSQAKTDQMGESIGSYQHLSL
jgi:hypothetical protein